jgi:hypothetical protein
MRSRVGGSPEAEAAEANQAVAQRLRELPCELPPPFDWTDLQRCARRRGRDRLSNGQEDPQRGARRGVLLLTGALTGVAFVLIAAAVLVSVLRENGKGPVPAGADPASVARNDARAGAIGDAEPMLQRAEAAERWLANAPQEGPVVRVSTYLVVTDLEDRIASVDDMLNAERLQSGRPAHVRALQLERAQLVDSLAQVRYAEMLDAGQ